MGGPRPHQLLASHVVPHFNFETNPDVKDEVPEGPFFITCRFVAKAVYTLCLFPFSGDELACL